MTNYLDEVARGCVTMVAYRFPFSFELIAWIVAATTILFGAILFLAAPSLSSGVFGAWMALWTGIGVTFALFAKLAVTLVGRADIDKPGYRAVALCISLLIASLGSPLAVKGAAGSLARIAEASFVVTPTIVANLEAMPKPAFAEDRRNLINQNKNRAVTTGLQLPGPRKNGCRPRG